jgi:hypothetical protein
MTRVVVVAAVLAVAGCGGDARPRPEPASAPAASRAACPVTAPGGDLPAGAPKGFDYVGSGLAVVLWPHGRLVAGELPDGGSYADVMPDGSIVAKLGWWRGAAGKLAIAGARLDTVAPGLSANVPDGYGSTGFQATAVTFPTTGCWKVVGSVATRA